MKTFVHKDGQQLGPYEDDEIVARLQNGAFSPSDFAWRKDMQDWQPLNTLYPAEPTAKPPNPAKPVVPVPVVVKANVLQPRPILAGTPRATTPSSPKTKTLPVVIGLVVVVGWILFQYTKKASTENGTPLFSPATTITSIEDVQKHVLGAWTYTGKEYRLLGSVCWEKWVFHPDGTLNVFSSVPTDDGWGSPKTYQWKPITEKYSDSGKRYFGIGVDGWAKFVPIADNGNLRYHPEPDLDVQFTKGDKFPFSK